MFQRELVVNAPLVRAWHHFNNAISWPSWHTDLTRVDVHPPGELGPQSVATLHPVKGPRMTFRMIEFVPCDHWVWTSDVLWFELRYDHRFEAVDGRTTRIILQIEVSGFGRSLFGPLVSRAAAKSLDKDLPRLAAEMDLI